MPLGRQPRAPQSPAREGTLRTRSRNLACGVLLLCAAVPAHAAPDLVQSPLPMLATRLPISPQLPAAPVHAIFRIDKSENRNQVYYGARVDEACRPVGGSPVYAYWRMRERGPNQTEALLSHEQPGYGVDTQALVGRASRGGTLRVSLRAWPNRPLKLELFRSPTGCAARAIADIQSQPAVVQSIYIDIGFLFSVNYAIVRGIRVSDGRPVHEKLLR